MKTYYVKYIQPEIGSPEIAEFQAEGYDHAIEQCKNFVPEATILDVTIVTKLLKSRKGWNSL